MPLDIGWAISLSITGIIAIVINQFFINFDTVHNQIERMENILNREEPSELPAILMIYSSVKKPSG